jgi:hypothetical protein
MTRTEMVLETLVSSPFNHLTPLVAQEYLLKISVFYMYAGKYDCELNGSQLSTFYPLLRKFVNVTVIC